MSEEPRRPLQSGIFGALVLLLLLLGGGTGEAFTSLFVLPQWSPQSQFAGMYMAYEKGFYLQRMLDVTLLQGGPHADPFKVLARGEADVVTQFLSSGLQARDEGLPLVLLGQVVNRSSLVLVARKDRGIEHPEDLAGRAISLWDSAFRLAFDLFFQRQELTLRIYPQYYSVNLFIRGAVDACAAMYYNEYHVLYQAGFDEEELQPFFMADRGFGFPEDGIYTTRSFFEEHPEACRDFVEATMEGWGYAREHPEETLDVVMQYVERAHVPTNRAHMRWMLAKILPCIFPESRGTWEPGALSREAYQKTAAALLQGKIIRAIPPYEAFVIPKEAPHVP